MTMLSELGINVVENEDAEEPAAAESEDGEAEARGNLDDDDIGRTDDPVRMYLREMGSVELLSREGEIAIAKRIVAGNWGERPFLAGAASGGLVPRSRKRGLRLSAHRVGDLFGHGRTSAERAPCPIATCSRACDPGDLWPKRFAFQEMVHGEQDQGGPKRQGKEGRGA